MKAEVFTDEPVNFTNFMVQVLSCLCNVVFPGEAFVEVQSEVFNPYPTNVENRVSS